jgi:hypothetical protein
MYVRPVDEASQSRIISSTLRIAKRYDGTDISLKQTFRQFVARIFPVSEGAQIEFKARITG